MNQSSRVVELKKSTARYMLDDYIQPNSLSLDSLLSSQNPIFIILPRTLNLVDDCCQTSCFATAEYFQLQCSVGPLRLRWAQCDYILGDISR